MSITNVVKFNLSAYELETLIRFYNLKDSWLGALHQNSSEYHPYRDAPRSLSGLGLVEWKLSGNDEYIQTASYKITEKGVLLVEAIQETGWELKVKTVVEKAQ